jgi:hypothetical protein
MSRIRIEGETTYSKEVIAHGVMNAVKDRLTVIKQDIQELDIDLESFRRKCELSDENFLEKFENGELGDDEDFFIWESTIKLKQKLIEEQMVLREAF